MSRISQQTAGQIAQKLTEASRKKVEKLHLEYRELVTSLYESQTPSEVSSLRVKFPDWFQTRTSIRFEGHGFRFEEVSSTRGIISNTGTYSTPVLNLTDKIASKITTVKRKWEKAKTAYDELKNETKQALLNLKTYNQIRENLPAAEKYLPPPMSNALVCNFDSLNKKLEHQPKPDHVPELHPK